MTDPTYEEQLKAANEVVYKHSLELARLKQELERANEQQQNLLHFISHEIKGFLTKGQNAFAGIVEGDYGEASPGVRALATGALHEMRKGVSTVMDILDASNFQKGTMSFDMQLFDIRKAVEEVATDLKHHAEDKGLNLELILPDENPCTVVGDETKLRRHVIRNLVDNAIRYTPNGTVKISLARAENACRLIVEDTGVGITEEDKPRLFTQGGHGKESIKVNVDSTGYGLFIAKEVTEAHKGTIKAESEGPGKGSKFTVDLPVA